MTILGCGKFISTCTSNKNHSELAIHATPTYTYDLCKSLAPGNHSWKEKWKHEWLESLMKDKNKAWIYIMKMFFLWQSDEFIVKVEWRMRYLR